MMFELTLNLIWAAVAVSVFAFVLPRTRPRWAGSIALLCILVLLFPIISVSDDLSARWEAIDEATAVRRAVAGALVPAHGAAHLPAVVLIAGPILVSSLALHGAMECPVVPTSSVLLFDRNSPRSPPRCDLTDLLSFLPS